MGRLATDAPRERRQEGARSRVSPEYGSDLVLDVLAGLEVEFASMNPGGTFRGLHDSLVNYAGSQLERIDCLHEEISVAIAHGYAKAAGKPMVALVHDIVGLQHASMAIYNAWCDRVPVMVLGATGPVDATKRRPWIDWIHTANVQATQVRDYTKWDDQPASIEAVPESLVRAHQLATAAPPGPVYVCLDWATQEERVPEGIDHGDPASFARPTPLAPEPRAVERLASWLVEAERPVILADRVGRSEAALARLVELAELLALPVVDRERGYNKVSLNFPTQHPLNLSGDFDGVLGEADLVVGLDTRDLFGSLHDVDAMDAPHSRPAPRVGAGVRTALVSVDYLVARGWSADHQRLAAADLHIAAEAEMALDALLPRVRAALEREGDGAAARIERRRRELSDRSRALREQWLREARSSQSGSGRVSQAGLALALGEMTAGRERVIANGSLKHWIHRLWDMDRAYQYCGGSGGEGLGYGLGASLGVALAHGGTERLVIDLQADGDALYTPQALWTAAHHRIPLLVIVDNNRVYNNTYEHAERIAAARGRPVERRTVGTLLDEPPVDFAALARSLGVHGEGPVHEFGQLEDAIERALRVVLEERRPALVDVVTEN